MTKLLLPAALLFTTLPIAFAPVSYAQEGPLSTQILVNVDAKATPPAVGDLSIDVNGHKEPLSAWTPVAPNGAQVAVLIDDGIRESVGTQLDTIRTWIQHLPAGTEVLVGYMENGRVVSDQGFTADHALAASGVHIPQGIAGDSASPYFCLSDFVKKWPIARDTQPANAVPTIGSYPTQAGARKARFVMMLTNGVDPYNGSTNPMNQDSPYVATAVEDAQRAGVAVYSIYYADAGFRGNRGSFSGQSYLAQLSQGTGGQPYFEGTGSPVSLAPFLANFQRAISETYIATFEAPAGKDPAKELLHLKLTSATKTKLHAPEEVRPGNQE
jgi:hypothetical protein